MYVRDGHLVLSPSDLVDYLCCARLSGVERAVALGLLERPGHTEPEAALLRQKGEEHEREYLARLEAAGSVVARIPDDGDLADRAARTLDALRIGAAVVYQATFLHHDGVGPAWRGHADFLIRVATPSRLGPYSYEPVDTKLARHVRPSAVLQLCDYAEQLARVQGRMPERIHVVGGDGAGVALRLADFAAYFRSAKVRFVDAVSRGVTGPPAPIPHCAVCDWRQDCDDHRLAVDDVTLVPGVGSEQARKLDDGAGVTTVLELARLTGDRVGGIGRGTLDKLRRQARLQVAARVAPHQPPPYELLATPPGIGLGALPAPSPGDLFFDMESDPFAEDAGLEYLFGVGSLDLDGAFTYRAFWAHSREEERAAFEAFVDLVVARLAVFPDLHVFHYAPYEPAALGRLSGRHGTRENDVDALLRGETLVDLYQVVRQGLQVGVPSYSLKKLEGLYMGARTGSVTDGGSSIVEYERWLETGDPSILDALAHYNQVDCRSTLLLRDWLEQRRLECGAVFGSVPARPRAADPEPPARVAESGSANDALRRPLREAPARGAPGPVSEERAAMLVGELLDWHRREDRPKYWRYYHRALHCDEEELFADTEAVAGLEYVGPAAVHARSTEYTYTFDPTQDFKLPVGQPAVDPMAERARIELGERKRRPGTLVSIDPVAGRLVLRRKVADAHPRCLIPGPPLPNEAQRDALRRVARAVIEVGVDGDGPYRAARDLVLRRPPRRREGVPAHGGDHDVAGGTPVRRAAVAVDDRVGAAIRVASDLASGCLAIQGPPGSGKTRAAALIAVELLGAGKIVGITANSHAVIGNLLTRVVTDARAKGVACRAVQKADTEKGVDHPDVVRVTDNGAVTAQLESGANLVAGTPWLFARDALDQRLDHLIVDEAGQVSLADTLAVATAAANLVLVGDPCQLSQPSEGTHPPGAEASALGHVLGGAPTIPADLGIFLSHTHRLHPDVCGFVSELAYEGRLGPVPGSERRTVGGSGALSGAGLRWVPVEHRGNRVRSPEEAAVVRRCLEDLVGRPFTEKDGHERALGPADVLVVAPYNAQVSLLGHLVPDGVRVGTVDRFQGQEAPVVIVSLTTSSPDEIPRGMDFLYSRNRLNVAVSRAQSLVVLVGSPELLAVDCRTVDQLRLANGLCRYVELATAVVV